MKVLLLFAIGAEQPYVPLMISSVRRHLPDYKIVQLTDHESPSIKGVDEILSRKKDPGMPMLVFRTEHFAHCPYTEWLALDADIIVKAPLDDVWGRRFDVALTTRRGKHCFDEDGNDITEVMPFNTGVIFSREPKFWHDCCALMQPPYPAGWWSDQLVVGVVAASHKYAVLTLPGDEFNWTPDVEGEASQVARIWHYKGNRKDWMQRERV